MRSRCCAVENLSLQELKSSLKSERVARRRAVTSLDVDRDSNKICPYKKKSLSEVRDSSVTSRCVPSLSDVLPTLQKRHGVEGVGRARRCACVQSARAGSRQKKITDICIFLFWSANAAARSISTNGRRLPIAHGALGTLRLCVECAGAFSAGALGAEKRLEEVCADTFQQTSALRASTPACAQRPGWPGSPPPAWGAVPLTHGPAVPVILAQALR